MVAKGVASAALTLRETVVGSCSTRLHFDYIHFNFCGFCAQHLEEREIRFLFACFCGGGGRSEVHAGGKKALDYSHRYVASSGTRIGSLHPGVTTGTLKGFTCGKRKCVAETYFS